MKLRTAPRACAISGDVPDGLLQIDLAGSDGDARLIVTGELDLATSPYLYERVAQALRDGAHGLVIDLSGVTFMDSSGLHTLMHLADDAGTRLGLILSAPAARVIDLTGTRNRLSILKG